MEVNLDSKSHTTEKKRAFFCAVWWQNRWLWFACSVHGSTTISLLHSLSKTVSFPDSCINCLHLSFCQKQKILRSRQNRNICLHFWITCFCQQCAARKRHPPVTVTATSSIALEREARNTWTLKRIWKSVLGFLKRDIFWSVCGKY